LCENFGGIPLLNSAHMLAENMTLQPNILTQSDPSWMVWILSAMTQQLMIGACSLVHLTHPHKHGSDIALCIEMRFASNNIRVKY